MAVVRLPAAEVGVAEAARVFEAEAEGAVEADMGDRYQGGRRNRGLAADETGQSKRDSERVCVREVVDDGADLRPREIGEHRDVRNEKAQREQAPRIAGLSIEDGRSDQRGGAFETQR